ncbi:MAG: flagellar hook-basal body protein [Lawsonibacter sp.]|nr:flagellar hook-basal body protein [Lawsonibacter sp.]
MNQSFYIGAVGAHQQLRHLNVHGDNIANVNTMGFKANKARFTELMFQNMRAIVDDEQPYGVGTRMLMTSTDFSQGTPGFTGRPFDYMIEGDGFFALADLSTGEISFTRNGAFKMSEYMRPGNEVDEEGRPILEPVFCLSDGQGRFVLSQEGGLIEVTNSQEELPIGIFDYINYDGMDYRRDTRVLPIEKNGDLRIGDGKLIQSYVEMSNTDLAEELSKVIEAQRAYGLALKMVQTSDEVETTINSLRS